MKIAYIHARFHKTSMAIIALANQIIEQYQAEGYNLTLRQLYYQFVARDLLPNSDRSYDRLGKIISKARLAGYIDWHALEDRTRHLRERPTWASPQGIISASAESYGIDLWAGQAYRPEVWVEKDALVGVFEPVCNELDIPLFSCRGYVSQSAMWRHAQRISNQRDCNVILHFGDHDPSGLDMSRDIADRLSMFRTYNWHFERVALSMEQIDEVGAPPNPAKVTDARYAEYAQEYGEESWELDALEPSYLVNLVRTTVAEYCDQACWNERYEQQEEERKTLHALANQWDVIRDNVTLLEDD